MKDLFKSSGKTPVPKQDRAPVSSKRDIADFLGKVASLPGSGGAARLIFALDATASRQPTWDMATRLQAEMFSTAHALGGLGLQLCYFRGLGDFFASDWQSSGDELLALMTQIRCQAGMTQLVRVLRHAIGEHRRNPLKGLVFIGDAIEESRDDLAQLAGQLGLLNMPLFLFQEGGDPLVREVFTELCRLSGGACSQFDAASAHQLRQLLQAVAVYAAGGRQALQDFSKNADQSVKLLAQQLKT